MIERAAAAACLRSNGFSLVRRFSIAGATEAAISGVAKFAIKERAKQL